MTFQQLQYLLEVQQTNSISKAASNLFVSNSSISVAVSSLEDELGFAIFNRSQKGLVPTRDGLRVLQYAERICKTYDQMNHIRDGQLKRLHISFRNYMPFCNAFARLVTENAHRDDITFSSVSLMRDDMIHKLASHELDLSLTAYFEPRIRLLEDRIIKNGLQYRFLKSVPAAVCVGPGHRLYNATSVHPRELENDIIVDNVMRPLVKSDYLHGVMCFKPENVVVCDSTSAQQLLRMGTAYTITIMPSEYDPREGDLHYIPLEGVDHILVLVTNPDHPLSPEANRFLELLDEELEKI